MKKQTYLLFMLSLCTAALTLTGCTLREGHRPSRRTVVHRTVKVKHYDNHRHHDNRRDHYDYNHY